MWDLAQTQTSSTVDQLMGHAAWMPRESRRICDSSVDACKTNRTDFKAYIDDGCRHGLSLFK